MRSSNIGVGGPYARPSELTLFPQLPHSLLLSLTPSPSLPLSLSPLARSSSEAVVHCTEKPRRHSLLTSHMARPVAALRESQSMPPFTRAWLSLITWSLRARGRSHTVSAPCEGIALLCEITVRQHLVRSPCFVKKNTAVSPSLFLSALHSLHPLPPSLPLTAEGKLRLTHV